VGATGAKSKMTSRLLGALNLVVGGEMQAPPPLVPTNTYGAGARDDGLASADQEGVPDSTEQRDRFPEQIGPTKH
jgi:hypothetical protein